MRGGRIGFDVTDHGSGLRFGHWPANEGNKQRKPHRQPEAEQRSGKSHDDLIQGANGRKVLARLIAFAFDDFHRGHLRQRDVAAHRDAAQAILHAVDFLFPKRFSEPDGEALHFEAPPARSQEMPQLMDSNQQIEEQQHFKHDENDG